MTGGFVERSGVRLHFREWKPEGQVRAPALFLLHGLSSNSLVWQRMVRDLPARRIVALDQRSHGPSDRPPSGYSAADIVEDAAHAIASLGLGRPVVAGHSWGAAIALELAATHPELASGLVIVDGPAVSMSGMMTWEEAQNRMQPPLPVYRTLGEAAAATRGYLGDAWGDDLLDFVRAGVVEVEGGYRMPLTAPVRLEILKALFHYQPDLLWPLVDGPILLAMATEPFPAAPPAILEWRKRGVQAVLEQRPDAWARWYDSLHDVPLIRPAELAADVERLAVTAGWYEVLREAVALDGDWGAPAPGEDVSRWDAKDLLAHIASVQSSMVAVLGAKPLGPVAEPRPPFDSTRWNASQVARRKGSSPADLVEEMRAASAGIAAALADADLSGATAIGPFASRPLRDTMEYMLEHQRGHLREARSALRTERHAAP